MSEAAVSNPYYSPRPRKMADRAGWAPAKTPAGRIVALFGGVDATAEAGGCSVKTIYRALAPSSKAGAGGRFSHAVQLRLIEAAAVKGLVLTHSDFAPKSGEAFI